MTSRVIICYTTFYIQAGALHDKKYRSHPSKSVVITETQTGYRSPRIANNVVLVCAVNRLRSKHSRTARRCSSLHGLRLRCSAKYIATVCSSLGGISSNVRGPLLRRLIAGLPLTLTTE